MQLKFRLACQNDLPFLVSLINGAYRSGGAKSWTSELNIVAGQRIDLNQLQQALAQPDFELWLLEREQADVSEVQGCIGLTLNSESAEIGTFCVDPKAQNAGLGRKLLAFAEAYIQQNHQAIRVLEMHVLHVRTELIAFYQRCGYVQTQEIAAYPVNANVGQPLLALHLVHLQKERRMQGFAEA
ncbi:GNAT family N-acetyltransferase [Acinetobacter sp.]|uniref:GNAT family N-acetyltransferase n=1 Tax=Acinetobacter sp. TaxID=472 RepID=UPI002FCA34BC